MVLFRKPLDSTQLEHARPNKECILLIRNFYKYLRSIPSPLWDARGTKINSCARFLKYMRRGGANKTPIVYKSGMNFFTILPYMEHLSRCGRAVRIEGKIPVYRITDKGEEAQGYLRRREEFMQDDCVSAEDGRESRGRFAQRKRRLINHA